MTPLDFDHLRKIAVDCHWPTSEISVKDLIDRLQKTENALEALRAKHAGLQAANSAMPDAHELWAAAQLAPGEFIEDGVARIEALTKNSVKPFQSAKRSAAGLKK